MASTLYILLPSKAVAQSEPDWTTLHVPFALVSGEGRIQQQGFKPWQALGEYVQMAHQVSLILAANDVSLLQAKVPPMSAAKLKAALPNLLEDQLIGDISEVVFQPGAIRDGVCTVAVADKAWVEQLHAAATTLGASHIAAFPAQNLLQSSTDATHVLIEEDGLTANLVIAPQNQEGFGLSVTGTGESDLLHEVEQAIGLLVPEAQLVIYVAEPFISVYQEHFSHSNIGSRANFLALNWDARIAAFQSSTFDLMKSLSSSSNSSLDWRAWRWPLGLAAAALLVNLGSLNTEWIKLKNEADNLKQSITRTYRTSFPQETVILDPLIQMRQKINSSKRIAGQSSPDDFLVLASQFAAVWDGFMAGNPNGAGLTSIEYRERSLFVKPKNASGIPIEPLRSSMQARNLLLTVSNEGVLQVKSAVGVDKK